MSEIPSAIGGDSRGPYVEAQKARAPRPSRDELYAQGKAMRDKCPRSSHAAWSAPPDRPDPVRLIEESDQGRLPELIPLRHERMLSSPFAFYRGTALNMAVDLADTPATGFLVQACGDAHLGNFRCFATPERRVIFDIDDLDETLPAPWEWDVKRLCVSFVVACRTNLSAKVAEDAVLTCVRSYRTHMADFSRMRVLDVWYASLPAEELFASIEDEDARARTQRRLARAQGARAFEDDFPKLVSTAGGTPTLKEDPPGLSHHLERGEETFYATIASIIALYRASLPDERRVLLDRFRLEDMALRVVGVGSVGTVCSVVLLMASEEDPLFLQVKEARRSVLEARAGQSVYENHGQRVVAGHRLMQAASDIFLGWTRGGDGRDFYVRQLRDAKIKFRVEAFKPSKMIQFADWCGATLARAHARSGEPALISGYLGRSDVFDRAIASYALAYADESERDLELTTRAVREGRLTARVDGEV
jgi:uncharacterized protein (DUF2252 family)